MPELPEVEVVRRGMLTHVVGRRIDTVEVFDPRVVARQRGGPPALIQELEGLTVAAILRRGKYLWLQLRNGSADHDQALVIHLGMSGQVRIDDPGLSTTPEPTAGHEGIAADPWRHERVRITLDTGVMARYVDQRMFGYVFTSTLVQDRRGLFPAVPEAVAHIAADALEPGLDFRCVARAIKSRRVAIKSALLNQELISGIGNIYADEALWHACLHPATPASAISIPKLNLALQSAKDVMTRALEVGGTSFDALYVNVDGRSGYFARSLAAYGKTGEPCGRCGQPIERLVVAQRSTHICPRCQRQRRTHVVQSNRVSRDTALHPR